MKIAHLTSVHPRYDVRIFMKECTSLAKAGLEVHLIVADGKGNEEKNDVYIHDVGASRDRKDRILNAPKKVLEQALILNADIYHFHDPELIPIGLKLKKIGKKVIFDIHENTDLQILTKEWIPLYLRKIISHIYKIYESYACGKFDFLLVPQVAMKDKFSRFARTEVIANFPVDKLEVQERNNLSKFNLLYSGGLGEARGLFNMLDLISVLAKKDKRYKLTLAGPISNVDLEKSKKHNGWKNTQYLGVLNKNEIYQQYKLNTIGLILFNNVGQYYMAYSLKLFEYMQSGLIVIMPDFGDWLGFNREFKIGFNISTVDVEKIAELIVNLEHNDLDRFSIHNQKLAASEFVWESQEKKLISIYQGLFNGN
ncbi:hypothetical protein F901_01150 [Acinetobacter dispersus]|uniref:glycosyltransferase n=1 Tax=Acinetobacter dispersus TaxID=70348 RepID=UPI0002CDB399|nr:glycosyltransferase [Acinetobacter dispersus]ENX53873.1 hypothetical protein F901_01150 [Acinetobacter dispersus]